MSKWGTWVNLWISQIHLTRQQKNVGENYDDLASRRLIRTRSTQEFACIFLKRDLNGKWSWSLLEFHRLNSRVEQRTRLVPDGLLAQNIIQWWIFLMTALHWFYFVTIQKSVSENHWIVCYDQSVYLEFEHQTVGIGKGWGLSSSFRQWPSQEYHLFLGLFYCSIFLPYGKLSFYSFYL